ncbi:hypothetical protein AB0D78_07870 [Streptomyces avermitilis]|uniref:hypothetical protein n=1 Tax=Streptomyces avermitilis TaxID=33903 RepID=UPI0033F2568F
MTKNEGAVWDRTDYAEAATELRRTLAERRKGPVPADLVVTTRAEIERREFRAYGQGWRDRGEHEERRGAATGTAPGTETARPPADGAKVLPFPHHHPSGPPTARPHPDDDPS